MFLKLTTYMLYMITELLFSTGIQQHLFDSGRTDCIFMDFGFEKLTNSFDEVTKTFLNDPLSPSKLLHIFVTVTFVSLTCPFLSSNYY